MNLALGTAQFGLSYGISNLAGQICRDEIIRILNYSKNNNIKSLDTAINYGESEIILGNYGVQDWSVVTKIPKIPEDYPYIPEYIISEVSKSLERLNIQKIDAVLLHYPKQLKTRMGPKIWEGMQGLIEDGLANKIGYSIYEVNELEELYAQYKPSLIQTPYNIFDDRIKRSGWLDILYKDKVEIHVRSVFLQGLLLMSKHVRPEKFNMWSDILNDWDGWLASNKLSGLEACLDFVMKEKKIDKIIVGVSSLDNLKEITKVAKAKRLDNNFVTTKNILDDRLLNPSLWDTF